MGILKIPFDRQVPGKLIRPSAKARLKLVKARTDQDFW